MSGLSFSPYSNLWFVGTDMGTLFRSQDEGKTWRAVNHQQATFSSDLTKAVTVGFSSDGVTIFHATGGINPLRSLDAGETFDSIPVPLKNGEYIKYWYADSFKAERIFCGTNKGLLKSEDKGSSWMRISGLRDESIGTFIDQGSSKKTVYHATKFRIWYSENGGSTFRSYYLPRKLQIRQFTGGRDNTGLTLAFLDNSGKSACRWVNEHKDNQGPNQLQETVKNCGFIWVNNKGKFVRTNQFAGDHLKMAENDASIIYATGGKNWVKQYGTKIFLSQDKGASWELKLHQLNWDTVPYEPWPQDRIEYSAIALDVGWWDDGYESFTVNQLNSKVAGGAGYFFLHTTSDFGDNWQAPFTQFMGEGQPTTQDRWRTTGIEVVSVYKTEFHPKNPNLLYVAMADIAGLVSEDGGKSFRITKAAYNSHYDYSFDPSNDKIVYAAVGNDHDWPNDWHANATTSNGGIYYSSDRGRSWRRLTPDSPAMNRQFLSVAYDPIHRLIYAGSHEVGIFLSRDQGETWEPLNDGLPQGNKIIPQIEINPKTGNAYALVTGDAPKFSNQSQTGIYYLDVQQGSSKWKLLRGHIQAPSDVESKSFWYYPTAFALDYSSGQEPETLWLVDYENNKNWLATGVWKSIDRGQSWRRVKQMTHATDIKIDEKNKNNVYVSGYYTLDGSWGDGGQISSRDGGRTWIKNLTPPLQHNARGVTLYPGDSRKIIYSYFGGGMLFGPDPNQ